MPARSRVMLGLATCALLSVALYARTYVDPDLGWILDYGAAAIEHGALPDVNSRSFTEPTRPLVMHGWLSYVSLAFAHDVAGGAPGVALWRALLTAAAACAAFALAWSRARTRECAVVVGVVGTVVAVGVNAAPFLSARAQLWSQVLLAVVLALALHGTRRAFVGACALFVVWPALHGAFVAGLGVLGVVAVGELIESRGREVRRFIERCVCIAGAGAVSLVGPYGFDFAKMTLQTVGGAQATLIAEWQPLWAPLAWSGAGPRIVVTFALALVAFALVPSREMRVKLLPLVALALSVSAVRHLRIAPILIVPALVCAFEARVIPRLIARAGDAFAARAVRIERLVLGVLASAALVVVIARAASGELLALHNTPLPGSPATAIAVLRANDLDGRVWNAFGYGGHLLWACPKCTVAVDGRASSAYSQPHIERAMTLSAADARATLESFGAERALIEKDRAFVEALAPYMTLVWCDDYVCLLSTTAPERIAVPSAPLTDVDLYRERGRPFDDASAP